MKRRWVALVELVRVYWESEAWAVRAAQRAIRKLRKK